MCAYVLLFFWVPVSRWVERRHLQDSWDSGTRWHKGRFGRQKGKTKRPTANVLPKRGLDTVFWAVQNGVLAKLIYNPCWKPQRGEDEGLPLNSAQVLKMEAAIEKKTKKRKNTKNARGFGCRPNCPSIRSVQVTRACHSNWSSMVSQLCCIAVSAPWANLPSYRQEFTRCTNYLAPHIALNEQVKMYPLQELHTYSEWKMAAS